MREHRLNTVRRARFYTLGGDTASDVWIVCHGFGQLAGSFAGAFERWATPQRLIVAPEALNRFYLELGPSGTHADARVGATWMTREDRENEIADYIDWLDTVVEHAVPRDARVTALGFSQGVATIARWITLGRARVGRLVAWAGQIPPDVDLARLRERLAGAPVVLVQGTTDRFAEWVKTEESHARLATSGIEFEVITFEGGHRLDDGVLDQLSAAI